MRIYARDEFKWVSNSLWLKDEYLLAVVEENDKPGMWRIVWADDSKSEDFYNKSRAKENALVYELRIRNNDGKKSL